MNYYQQEVRRLTKELYPHDELVNQVVRSKQFIDKHFARALTLKEIAGEAFISKFHFIRVFKNMYGHTPYQYLKAVRVEKAKQLLQKGQPVTTVCFSVGFDSASSFTGFFKRMTGSTPSAFQKNKLKGIL